ncbi:MAG: large conductance mechanosensitive channel protein MscL [Lachnospiraceae bacterium]|nr:large conductance mechanosensitive channel protein MscL [Lachnospiraceae bacterium]
MKKFFGEFKTFIMRGNVLDMAVGVVIATAFGKITNSLVSDIIMPVIGKLTGGIDLNYFNITIREAVLDEAGVVVQEPIKVGIGNFLVTIIDFIIIAFVIFIVIKAINKASEKLINKNKEEEKAKGPTEIELLSEILNEIKKNK